MASFMHVFRGLSSRVRPAVLTSSLHKCGCKSLRGSSRAYSVYEPDDIVTEAGIPEYEPLNIRMRGYDFVVLESFAKYAHNLTKSMGLDATMWAVPAKTTEMHTFKPNSSKVQNTYNLAMYERTVQVQNLPSTMAPLLFEVLQQNMPEGVNFTVKEPEEEEEEFRFVPDVVLLELQAQVDELDKAKEDRRK